MVTDEEIITHYKHVAGAHLRRTLHRPSISVPEDRAAAREFLRWAQGHDIDPCFWITEYVAFMYSARRQCPMFRSLRSEKALPAYKIRERAWRALREQHRAAETQRATDVQKVVDLSLCVRTQEDVRHRYLRIEQQPELCRSSMHYSGGFDPRSKFCPQCPQAIACSQEMNERYRFNVVALRSGDYSQLPEAIAKIAREHVRRLPVR